MATQRLDRLRRAEAHTVQRAHRDVIWAATHEEAMQEAERRAAAGELAPPPAGLLIVPPDDESIETWEARQRERPQQD